MQFLDDFDPTFEGVIIAYIDSMGDSFNVHDF